MKKLILTFLICCGIVGGMAGCSADGLEAPGSETGELTLRSLNMDRNTRSVDDLGLDPETFKVEIIDAQQSVIKTYPTFAEMPSKVRLPIGPYTVRASLGDPDGSGFDAWYFAGEKSVSILSRQLTNETVVCALANVKVAVVFGANLLLDYSDFSAEVKSGAAEEVLFTKEELRAGYMPAGDLVVTIHMTNNQGRKRSYTAQAYTAYPQEFVTFNIDTEDNPGDLNITIGTDSETDDREVIIRLYDFMNAKDAPVITGEGFDATDLSLTYLEGIRQEDVRVSLRAEGTIQSCVVKPDAALQALGWPAEFDLADPALDPSVTANLKSLGLSWYERMKGAVVASVDMRDAAAKLRWQSGEETLYTFTVETTDSFGQTCDETFTLAVKAPMMALNVIPDYDMWAYHIDMTGTFMGVDQTALKLQYKTTGEWTDCASATPTIDGTSVDWRVKGLSDNTDYQFRMVYGALESETCIARTEEAKQIPNSDFENWYEYKAESRSYINQYYLQPQEDSDPWWATRNPATAGQYTGVETSYTTLNTTFPREVNGNQAAAMRTGAWGAGTTTAGSISVIYNIFSGVMYIGSYSRTLTTGSTVWIPWEKLNAETIAQGHIFPSRPAKLQFDYMYDPYSGDKFMAYAIIESNDGVEIARADATDTGTSQNSMKQVSFDFVYTDKTKKATTIKVFFSSSDKLSNNAPPVAKSGVSGGPHWGSTFTIDNLHLNYNFD